MRMSYCVGINEMLHSLQRRFARAGPTGMALPTVIVLLDACRVDVPVGLSMPVGVQREDDWR
jgi:hypothetical protein